MGHKLLLNAFSHHIRTRNCSKLTSSKFKAHIGILFPMQYLIAHRNCYHGALPQSKTHLWKRDLGHGIQYKRHMWLLPEFVVPSNHSQTVIRNVASLWYNMQLASYFIKWSVAVPLWPELCYRKPLHGPFMILPMTWLRQWWLFMYIVKTIMRPTVNAQCQWRMSNLGGGHESLLFNNCLEFHCIQY